MMDQQVFRRMLLEARFLKGDLQNREQLFYLDNVSSHDETDEVQVILPK